MSHAGTSEEVSIIRIPVYRCHAIDLGQLAGVAIGTGRAGPFPGEDSGTSTKPASGICG